ncbi:hypothetical protein [Mixta mediterraneensis]|uniref:hypothetical protein n=1 Tax=Mixta mediterraneensis TaxID=2758443 RepID=UPI001874C429|nr:hypothetical protein [Mixta mediterraneensis]MBE5251837.1 hypothetical protein [Mixta mediterraneensis]
MKKAVFAALLCLFGLPVFASVSLTPNEVEWLKSKADAASLNCDTYSKEGKKSVKGLKISIPDAYYSKYRLLPESKLNCLLMEDHLGSGVNQLVVNEVANIDGNEVEIPHHLGAAIIKGNSESEQWVAACSKDAIDDSVTCNIHQKNLFIFKQGNGYTVVAAGRGAQRGTSFVRVDKSKALKSNSDGRFDVDQSQAIISAFTEGKKAIVRSPSSDGDNQDETISLGNFTSALKVMNLMADSRM